MKPMGPTMLDPEPHRGVRGRFGVGFLQALGISLAMVVPVNLLSFIGRLPSWLSFRLFGPLRGGDLGFLACVLLGLLQARRGRKDTATGLYVGALAWYVVLYALLVALVAFSLSGPDLF
jgi:hypothetical protein